MQRRLHAFAAIALVAVCQASAGAQSVDAPADAPRTRFDYELMHLATLPDDGSRFFADVTASIDDLANRIRVEIADPRRSEIERARLRRSLAVTLAAKNTLSPAEEAERAHAVETARATFAAENVPLDGARLSLNEAEFLALNTYPFAAIGSADDNRRREAARLVSQTLSIVTPDSGYTIYLQARCLRDELEPHAYPADLELYERGQWAERRSLFLGVVGGCFDAKLQPMRGDIYSASESPLWSSLYRARVLQGQSQGQEHWSGVTGALLYNLERYRAIGIGLLQSVNNALLPQRELDAARSLVRRILAMQAQRQSASNNEQLQVQLNHLRAREFDHLVRIATVLRHASGGIDGDVAVLVPSTNPVAVLGHEDNLTYIGPPVGVLSAWRESYQRGDYRAAIDGFVREGSYLGSGIRASLNRVGKPLGSRVALVVDGPLSRLPLGLLRDATTGHTLIEDYELSIAPNYETFDLAARADHRPSPMRLAFVGAAGRNAPALIGAEQAGLARILRSAGGTLTQTAGYNDDALVRSPYWHFSAHGRYVAEDPYSSGLSIGSQTLTLSQLQDLIARGEGPRLVFLAACETALVDTDRSQNEFLGLPGALIGSGAAAVIGSLWPVSDVAATLLSTRFYDGLSRRRLRPGAALREAQLWLRSATHADIDEWVSELSADEGMSVVQADMVLGAADELSGEQPFADPVYWGGWTLYGL